jgi:hypothetical protein
VSGQHPATLPDDCRGCRALFAALLADHQEPPAIAPTVDVLGQRAGLGRRAAFVHLAHLVTHRRIREDRRTPVPGAAVGRGQQVPPDADALTWAACQEVPDAACARCLAQFARAAGLGWSGQLGERELAEALGVSERTARTHRGHLVRAALIRFTPSVLVVGDGHRVRQPDRFTLLSGVVAAPVLVPGGDWTDDLAATMLSRLWWFDTARKRDSERGRVAIARRLRAGWSEGALMERLERAPDGAVTNPYGRLAMLLPAPDQPHVVPASEAVGGVIRLTDCRECGIPFRPRFTGALCGGEVCRNPEPNAGPVDLGAVRRQFHALTSA